MATANPQNAEVPAAEGPAEVSLYEKWRKIYPQWVKGGFQKQRRIVLGILYNRIRRGRCRDQDWSIDLSF